MRDEWRAIAADERSLQGVWLSTNFEPLSRERGFAKLYPNVVTIYGLMLPGKGNGRTGLGDGCFVRRGFQGGAEASSLVRIDGWFGSTRVDALLVSRVECCRGLISGEYLAPAGLRAPPVVGWIADRKEQLPLRV